MKERSRCQAGSGVSPGLTCGTEAEQPVCCGLGVQAIEGAGRATSHLQASQEYSQIVGKESHGRFVRRGEPCPECLSERRWQLSFGFVSSIHLRPSIHHVLAHSKFMVCLKLLAQDSGRAN